jgi:hypothetical protein
MESVFTVNGFSVDIDVVSTLQKVIGITECIFSVLRDVFTPFHIGLAVQLYHDIGSKQLINGGNAYFLDVTPQDSNGSVQYLVIIARICNCRYLLFDFRRF